MKDSEGSYARILRRIVDDPDYARLSPVAKLVWLTMLLSPEFRLIGIAPLDVPVMVRRTGYSTKPVEAALDELEQARVISRDGVWVWIRNHLRFQENSESWTKSEKTMKGLSRMVNSLPNSLRFLPNFIQTYSALGFSFDLAHRISSRIDTPINSPIDNQEPETHEQEPEQEQETHEPETPQPVPDRMVAFEHWKTTMPGRQRAEPTKERMRAVDASLKVYPLERIIRAIDGCRASKWHQGENDRKKPFNDLELICRDGKHLEEFELMAINTQKPHVPAVKETY